MTLRSPHLRLVVAAGTLGGLLLVGCAQADPESPSPSPSVGGTVNSPSPTPPPASVPPSPPASGEITVTGTVELVDIEGGCLVLHAGSTTYELQGGDRDMLKNGARVTVRGIVRDDMATICQIGPVLEVLSSQPA